MKKIKVLIVDDSSLIRKLLSEILETDKDIEVVGTAQDPFVAREKIKKLKPDVITLDVEMPRMDGITFLKNLMRLHPIPVIMISSLTEKGADITLEALASGAVDFVSKPKLDLAHSLPDYTYEITSKVKAASTANVHAMTESSNSIGEVAAKNSADVILEKNNRATKRHFKTTDTIIALGASTGGTEAIKEVLMKMPADAPGMVISQHIPEAFSTPFAKRMNGCSAMTVYEAHDGQQILPGHAYIAPGSHHLLIERDGARFVCRLNDGLPVNRHRPSVDVMFRSVAQNVGHNAIGVILTGMGDDGAAGMKELNEVGAATIAQDEKTSVVWGMPGEAVKLGGVDSILPLNSISAKIITLVNKIK
ncbi:MAG: chemotaxis response regulator protein-glutamate methylesterase [Thiotrichaceae bacterium]|nr:chemotaxis response regulator protein-glutamate methylesterase [Thiotrichaceae bacterium]